MNIQTDNEVAIELINILKSDTTLLAGAEKTKYTIVLPSGEKILAKNKFSDMSLDENLIDGIHNMGYEKPSMIQAAAIPAILTGTDVVVQSQSGTGKTISFVVPILNTLQSNGKPQAVVLTPTRGLNVQVGEIFKILGKSVNIKCYVVSDEEYKDCEVIVGSPGGLLNLVRSGAINPDVIKVFVIDEADACLDSLGSQTIRLLKYFEKSRKIFFSATYTPIIKNMINKFAPNITELYEESNRKPDEIKLFHIETKKSEKASQLLELYEYLTIGQLIIFTNSKAMAKNLQEEFKADKHQVSCIHGDMDMTEREKNVSDFRNAVTRILIATDVFSRGMDIPQVNLIVNFDMPFYGGESLLETYIHRIGRSGRFGRAGFVIDFISGKEDYDTLLNVQTQLKCISKKFTLQALRDVYYKVE